MNYKTNNTKDINIDDFTKCYICLSKIQDASMCPNCQKISCQRCIQKWLLERKNQCPHCRMPLKLSQIINVRFINELSNILENISICKDSNKTELCKEHEINILYFCVNCNESLCSDCYMFSKKHKDHEISKLDQIYSKHVDSIKNETKETQKKCDQLNSFLKLINEKIISVGNYKLEKNNELEELFENLKNKLESRIHLKLTKLMSCKNEISEKLKYLDNVKLNIEKELYEAPKSVLISKSEDLIQSLKNLNLNSESFDTKLAENINLNISAEVPSDIFPQYEFGIFEINDYKKLINIQPEAGNTQNQVISNTTPNNPTKDSEVIYSPELITNGLIWRLKVYPNGNGAAKGEYISIFLELIEGLYETSKYYYKIELCNFFFSQGDKRYSNYSREFSSDFTNGECWGYNRFYKIENLEREGYIDNMGKLIIKFYVRPQTYSQLCRDQKNFIITLEKRLKFYMTNYTQLKEKNYTTPIEQNVRTSEEIAINNFNMINNINNACSNNNEDRILSNNMKIEREGETNGKEEEEIVDKIIKNSTEKVGHDIANLNAENSSPKKNLNEGMNFEFNKNEAEAMKYLECNEIKIPNELIEDRINNDLLNSDALNRENQNCLNNLNNENLLDNLRKSKTDNELITFNTNQHKNSVKNFDLNEAIFEKDIIKNLRNSCENFEFKLLQDINNNKDQISSKLISNKKQENFHNKKLNPPLDNFIDEMSFENSCKEKDPVSNNMNMNYLNENNFIFHPKKFDAISSEGSSFDSIMDSIKLMEDAGNSNSLNNNLNLEKKGLNLQDNFTLKKMRSDTEREDVFANKKYNLVQNKFEKDMRRSSDKITEMLSNLYPENSFKLAKNYPNKNPRDVNTKAKVVENFTNFNFAKDVNSNNLSHKSNIKDQNIANPSTDLINNNDLGRMEEFRNMMKSKRKEIRDYKQI